MPSSPFSFSSSYTDKGISGKTEKMPKKTTIEKRRTPQDSLHNNGMERNDL
jgi:hypothetical protein